jgi:ABC-type transporter MlaC component
VKLSPLAFLNRGFFAAVALLVLNLPTQAAGTCAAAPFVLAAGMAYDQAARSGSAAAFADGVDRFSDMRAVALFALGRYRGQLPKAREAEFIRLTKSFMGRFMLENGGDFRVGKLQIVECTGSGANINVTARTASGNKVAFRIAKQGSGYTMKDMRASGIWLVQQMRSTFVGTISRNEGDIDALFKYLKR